MTPSQQGQVTQTVLAKGRRGRFKLLHKHAGQHHHCRSLTLEKFGLHLDLEIHESKILSVAAHLLHQHIYYTARNYLLVFRKKNHFATHRIKINTSYTCKRPTGSNTGNYSPSELVPAVSSVKAFQHDQVEPLPEFPSAVRRHKNTSFG